MITLVGSGCCGLRDMFIFFHAPDLKMFCLTSNIEIREEVFAICGNPGCSMAVCSGSMCVSDEYKAKFSFYDWQGEVMFLFFAKC